MKTGRSILLALALLAGACGSANDRPSVLLITVDTLRADAVGAFGNPDARTPRMDRLAAEGTRFTRAKTVCPITLPAHLTILSGLYPAEHGFRDNDPPRPLSGRTRRGYETLPETFSDAGYDTAAFVSASVLAARTGIDAGFRIYDGPTSSVPGSLEYAERTGRKTAEHAAEWIGKTKSPFFLWVHLFDPHDPYLPPVAFRSGGDPESPKAYADEVAYADHCVGIILDALERTGRAGDTLVVLTSDHGEGLGEHGESTHAFLLYETTLAVPLVLRWPERILAGVRRDDLVSLVDLADTIRHATLDTDTARSFYRGPSETRPVAETLYGYRHMGWAQLLCGWDDDGKLIRGVDDEYFDLVADPRELAPKPTGPASLPAAILSYRNLSLFRERESGETLDPLAGHAYLTGVGRGRLALIPEAENRNFIAPDGGMVDVLGRIFAAVGRDDPGPVRRELERLIRKNPANPSLPWWLGRNEAAAGRHREAAAAFSQAFEKGHREARVLSLWLKSLIQAGEVTRGLSVAEQHITEIVPNAGTWVMVGTLQMLARQWDRADRALEKAAALARSEKDLKLVSRFRHKLAQSKDQ